jgi:hypothetical protein
MAGIAKIRRKNFSGRPWGESQKQNLVSKTSGTMEKGRILGEWVYTGTTSEFSEAHIRE